MIEACIQCSLITFGVAFCGALTSGPFGVFKLLRDKVKASTDREWIKEGASCPVCHSFWFGLLFGCLMSSSVSEALILWGVAVGFVCVVTSLSPE